MKYIEKPANKVMIEHLMEYQRGALWAQMGLGKTSSTLAAAILTDKLIRPAFPMLVVAPKRVAETVWSSEIEKWDHLSGLRCSVVLGNAEQRKAALNRKADVYTVNFENVLWLRETLGKRWPFRTVVIDEATKLKGFRLRNSTLRSRALAQIAHFATDTLWELTGTPRPQSLTDLWGPMWFLDRGVRLGRSYTAFIDRWFDHDRYTHEVTPRSYAFTEIVERCSDIAVSLRTRDYLPDVRDFVFSPVEIELPSSARALYERMEDKKVLRWSDEEIMSSPTAMHLSGKLQQIASGTAYLDEDEAEGRPRREKPIHTAKLDALDSVLTEYGGEPVIIVYQFQSEKEMIRRAHPDAVMLSETRDTLQLQRDWNAGKIRKLVMHPASGGHGLNLQTGGRVMVLLGLTWSLELYQQVIERIGPTRQLQSGHDREVYLHPIVARDTVDERILLSWRRRAEEQDQLMFLTSM